MCAAPNKKEPPPECESEWRQMKRVTLIIQGNMEEVKMNDQNIQHTDITSAERTGYPARRMVSVPLTDKILRNYIWEQRQEFIDFCMMRRDVIGDYLRSTAEDFEAWCREALESE